MVVTGSCLRMSTSETGCASSQKVDEKVRINRGLQTLCHLNSRLPAGNTDAGRWNNMENRNLSELDQEGMSDGDAVISESVTIPVCENISAATRRMDGHYFGTKGDMVFSLLSVLGTHNKEDMSRTLLAMSASFESCVAMRQSGCLPLLIHLLHGSENDASNAAMRSQAAAALHNIIHVHCEDQRGRQEARVLRLLEQVRSYCDYLRSPNNRHAVDHLANSHYSGPYDYYPGPSVAALMKLSFDEEHRHAVCTLGGVQAIAELLQMDHEINGNTTSQYHVTMRRYACMALTNLTFGDGTNKALLCSMVPALKALVQQVESLNEDLSQVAASVLRNLSWHADFTSKRILRDVGAVPRLMRAALVAKKESTLKSLLSALWNFSSHCIENKADICATDGALQFLVKNLTYRSPLKTLSIIENCGGILRNVSSHIAIHEDYRTVLRQHGCLQILLKHLRSPSLTIVSNACGTLWNLSARCIEDQKMLLELGAVNMLKNLVHSKHKMISMGSAAALKNLLSAMPALQSEGSIGPAVMLSSSKSDFPGLHMRRQKALESELEQQNLSETCDNMESPQISPSDSPKMEMHTMPKNNTPVIEFLTGSAARMTSSLRAPLPADVVGHVYQASVDGMTDRKRVNKILHRSNLLLHDRQSPVVGDSVDLVAREMRNTGGVDLMYGSHSHLQDVKMMHSFSNYCEPTASTSPESSPTGRNATLDSTRRFFHPCPDSQLSTDASADEDGFAKSDIQDSEESCLGFCTMQTTRPGFTLSSKGRDPCEPAVYNVGDEGNSSLSKTDFTQNRLSIACSENLFSFDCENSENCKLPPDDPQDGGGGDSQGNSSADDDTCGRFGKSFDVSPPSGGNSGSWGHVFDIEDIQGIASEQPTTDIHRTNLYRYSGFQDVEQRLNSSFSSQTIEKEAFEHPDSQKPCVALRQNCSNSSGYFHNDVQQVNAGNMYGETFLPSSVDVDDEDLPVSPNSLCYNDMFELKVSVTHDFRRLSSTGSHGDDSQDDDNSVQDGDDIVIEEVPVASNEVVVVDDETNGMQVDNSELCLLLPHNSQSFDVLKVGNDNMMPVASSRSLDLLSAIPQTEFHDDASFFLQPEILRHSLKAQDLETADYASNVKAEVFSDSRMDVFQLADANQNANCLVKGPEIFSGDCFPEQTSSNDTNTLPKAFFDESLRPETSELVCTSDSFGETGEFVLVDYCEKGSKCNVLRDVIEPGANNSCDPYFIKVDRCNVTESFRSTSDSIIDIMNESFPDLSSSLISEMATSHEDFLAPEGTRYDKPLASASEMPHFEVFEAFAEVRDNNAVARVDEENKNLETEVFSGLNCDQILLEQELALEENANIILSELEKTTLLGSVGSETHLLEFETLSLVSNDEEDMADRDDDDSEGSYSLSVTSISQSEPSSERCLSAPQAQATSRPSGPRIVKPVAKDSLNVQKPQKESSDAPKAVRGRRRLLYSAATNKQPNAVPNTAKSVGVVRGGSASNGRVSNTSAVQCKAVEKPNIVKPVRPAVARTVVPKSNINVKNAPENVKKPPVRINRGVTPLSSAGQTKPRAPSLPSERRPLPQNRQVKSAPVRSKIVPERSEDVRETAKKTFTQQAIFTPERSQMENEILADQGNSFLADLDENQDRPKPPIKQDTFVKDASSFSVVVVDSKSKEALFRKEKEKEVGQVGRSSAEPGAVGCSAQPVRRASPALPSTGGTARGRQQKADISTGRRNPIPDSQISRPRASYSVPSTGKAVNKVVSRSAGNPSKMSTFNKKPAVPSNASPSGSNCSLSSVGKTSISSSGYADKTRTQVSDERLSSASPKQKVINVEKSSHHNYLARRTAVPHSDQPVTNKTEKTVPVVQQDTSARGRVRQQPKQPVRQTDIIGRVPVVSTLTRSSTYDKLTEDDLNVKTDEPNGSTTSNDFDTKSNTSKEMQVKPTDINPRRLTHVVESTMKFDQSFPVEDDDDDEHSRDESERIAKSQDCAELTLNLNTKFSTTDPLYSGRSLTLDRSTVMSSDIFEKYEEPKVMPESQVLNLSRSTRASSTLPRSLFSAHHVFSPRRPEQQISAREVPDDEFLVQDSSKLSSKSLRYKESRKLGFGLWRRNNASAKGKPENEEKQDRVLQKSESKAGSPVHKVFGWFRKAGESGKKGLTSRIPGPESSKPVEAGNSDRCAPSHKGSSERQAGLARSNSPLKAAIVQPFNYRPLVKVSTLANEMQHESSQEPMTKTEMLLARRRQSRAASGCRDSVNSEDNLKLGVSDKSKKLPSVPSGKGPKSGFLVTSV